MKVFSLITILLFSLPVFSQSVWKYQDQHHIILAKVEPMTVNGIQQRELRPAVTSIEIYQPTSRLLEQIILPDTFIFDSYMDSSSVLIYEDVNFDGYKDIRLLNWLSVNLQRTYWYWIYSPEKNKFVQDTVLKDIWNVSFNPKQKTIHSWWRVGMNELGHALYKWNNGVLELVVKEEESWGVNDYGDEVGWLTVTRMKKGIEKISDKEIKEHTSVAYHNSKCPLK